MSNDVSYTRTEQSAGHPDGARSNPWTMQLDNNHRIPFERTDTTELHPGQQNPGKRWGFELGPPEVDYIVITQVF